MSPPTGTQEEMRRRNLSTLLRLLHIHGSSSRAELTAATGLNRSTVRALVTELAGLRLVTETRAAPTGAAGRPSILVEPGDCVYTVAVDVGVEHLAAARIGLAGVVLERREQQQARGAQDVDVMVRRVARLIGDLVDAAPADTTCVGVAVAVPGLVTDAGGAVRSAPNLDWTDVPFGQLLARRLGGSVPVLVGNEADLAARAEQVRGAAAGRSDVCYIAGEVGIGGGIITGGRPLQGTAGYAGEIGHMIVNPGGRNCSCGSRGCWESEIGERAILAATGSAPGTTVSEVRAAFDAGDPAARAGLRHIGHWIGVGVVNIVNIFNPEIVIFGGHTREIFAAAEPYIQKTLDVALTAPRSEVTLALSGLAGDSSLIGAAELAFEALLANPAEVTATSAAPSRQKLSAGT